jgi:hypothetical protein
MTSTTLAKHLFSTHEHYRLDHLAPGNCKHERVFAELFELVVKSNKLMAMEELGLSIEGRSINMITVGTGNKKVLLWSQMHGDEPTATLALMDIFSWFAHCTMEEKGMMQMLKGATLYFIPMLNPDGAERVDRRTAVGIDMNRDALDLATPEACILRQAQHRLKPMFGFNLHDQELSSVGNSKRVTALALLAPAADEKKSWPPVRMRAMRLAALLARTFGQFAEGHLASYDDAFEPRAFGDNMQRWGTSTVLIESGQWPNDPEKRFIRKLNYVGILTALHAISNGSYQDVDLDYYAHLPSNAKRMYDVLIRDVKLHNAGGWEHAVDIGLSFDPLLNRNAVQPIATVREIGNLSTHGALQMFNGASRTVRANRIFVNQSLPFHDILDILQLPQGKSSRTRS